MKTLLFGIALTICGFFASAQDTRTSLNNPAVVNTPNGMAVQLTWTKGSENVAYYIVERSNNGIDFTRCALVFTSEDPEFVEYKFRDKIASLSQGLVYRLAVVNEQKRVSYLPPKTVVNPVSL